MHAAASISYVYIVTLGWCKLQDVLAKTTQDENINDPPAAYIWPTASTRNNAPLKADACNHLSSQKVLPLLRVNGKCWKFWVMEGHYLISLSQGQVDLISDR